MTAQCLTTYPISQGHFSQGGVVYVKRIMCTAIIPPGNLALISYQHTTNLSCINRSEQDREAVLTALTSQASFGRAVDVVRDPALLQAHGLLLEAEGIWLRR